MGTRSITRIFDSCGKTELVCIYRQMDGYPDGHGQELADIVGTYKLVNGIIGMEPIANGYECLAALVVRDLKVGPGGIYIYPPGSEAVGEAYEYHVKPGFARTAEQSDPPEPAVISVFEVYSRATLQRRKLFECAASQYRDVCATVMALRN